MTLAWAVSAAAGSQNPPHTATVCNAGANAAFKAAARNLQTAAWRTAITDFARVSIADPNCGIERWRPLTAERLLYAYLQTGQDDKAHGLVEHQGDLARHPLLEDDLAIAALPALYALERSAWDEAAALKPVETEFPQARAVTVFARALGAARLGDQAAAARDTTALQGIAEEPAIKADAAWSARLRLQQATAEAWLRFAAGSKNEALAEMRAAATDEAAMPPVEELGTTVLPGFELFGDMLYDAGDPAAALQAYETALQRAPGRMRSFWGACRAAEEAGERVKMKHYCGEFAAACEATTCTRPGRLTAAKRSMAPL